MITIELEGRKIRVPEGLTVIEALWDTGHEVKRGIGCLSGLCGACTVAYLEAGAQRVKFGLGCQTVVAEGMNVIMLPVFPVAHRPIRYGGHGQSLCRICRSSILNFMPATIARPAMSAPNGSRSQGW